MEHPQAFFPVSGRFFFYGVMLAPGRQHHEVEMS
jgi:hypothetical protein